MERGVDMESCAINPETEALLNFATLIGQIQRCNPEERLIFTYARVHENPTSRWSTWDALELELNRGPDLNKTPIRAGVVITYTLFSISLKFN